MPILKAVNSKASLERAVSYVERKAALLDGINCRAEYALDEMEITRSYYGKTGGRTYYHYVLSFPPEAEITPERCRDITREVVEANPLLHGHEVLIAVHTDTDHTHAHIIASSVRATDGKKYHITKPQYRTWIETQQRICMEHGYEPAMKKEKSRGDFITDDRLKYEVVRRKGRDADIVVVYQTVKKAMKEAKSWNEFENLLACNNVSVEHQSTRKHVVFGYAGHKFRDSNLSRTFTDMISKEVIENGFELLRNDECERDIRDLEEIGRETEVIAREVEELIRVGIRKLKKSHREARRKAAATELVHTRTR